jgi:IS605 OrfB family transposase
MQIKKAYRFQLKPTPEQAHQMECIAGGCRFVWNKVLACNLKRLERKEPLIWYYEADFWSKLWKQSEEYSFLKEVPAHCLQQKLKDLDRAFRDGFDKTQPNKRLPKFRKKGLHDSFRFPEPKQIMIDNRRIKLPKLGWIRFFKSRDILGDICNATLSKQGQHWFVAIQVELHQEKGKHRATSMIGMDLGVVNLVTDSNGEQHAGIALTKTYAKQLASAQRGVARKVKYSKNWQKACGRVKNIHSKIANSRRDLQHKLSTRYSKNHAAIVVEALQIKNMSAGAHGTVERPGKNVRAKSGLNKVILDQGFGEFLRQLAYKLAWSGGELIRVSPQYTSQRCYGCGHTAKENRTSQAVFECVQCGMREHADINAARNILAAGHAVLACGESGLPFSMKQEPLATGDCVLA